jgi:hypothetical protein
MSTVLTRSTAEILRLTRAQWDFVNELTGFLIDLTGVSSPPTAASSISTWLQYALITPTSDEPSVFLTSGSFSYNTTLNRAQTGELTFNFTSFIANNFDDFNSTTVTHVMFADVFNLNTSTTPPQAILQESTPITLTSSSTLSYKIRLFGRAA